MIVPPDHFETARGDGVHLKHDETMELAKYITHLNKENKQLRAANDRLREALTKGIAGIDEAEKKCPVAKSKRFIPKCPKCGSESDDVCGLNATALYDLEVTVRQALSHEGE